MIEMATKRDLELDPAPGSVVQGYSDAIVKLRRRSPRRLRKRSRVRLRSSLQVSCAEIGTAQSTEH